MTTKFNVGDNILIEGVVNYIHIETIDNVPVYHVRIKGAGLHESYCIRVRDDTIMEVKKNEQTTD